MLKINLCPKPANVKIKSYVLGLSNTKSFYNAKNSESLPASSRFIGFQINFASRVSLDCLIDEISTTTTRLRLDFSFKNFYTR